MEGAERHYRDALKMHRETGNRLGEARQLGNLGLIAGRRGEVQRAQELLRQALEIFEGIGAGTDVEQTRRHLARIEEQKKGKPGG